MANVQLTPGSRYITINQDLKTGNLQVSVSTIFSSPENGITQEQTLSYSLDDSKQGGMAHSALNGFLGMLDNLLSQAIAPNGGEGNPTPGNDSEASTRINDAAKES